MELTNRHILLLKRLHKAEVNYLNVNGVKELELSDPGFLTLLEELEAGGLVEYEGKKDAWYLSPEGFEVVDRLDDEDNSRYAKPVIDEDDISPLQTVADRLGGTKKFTRIVLGLIFLFGLAATLSALLGDEQSEPSRDNLIDSTRMEMPQDTADSTSQLLE